MALLFGAGIVCRYPQEPEPQQGRAEPTGTAARNKDKERQRKLEATDKLHAKSSYASRARRAVFNASAAGEENFLGESELVDDVAGGRVDLSSIDRENLPETMKAMAPAEQQALIEGKTKQRGELQQEINELSEKRATYLKKKVGEAGGAEDSLDAKIYRTVREQAGEKGLVYEADAPSY